ncbi:hypothetical protein [Photobacterium leiognathi]|uniref:hypothetical protein n=1 Tax=Photobacterium leiognathi TaxID=553611 RepID=UPI002981D72A|nr:hypothetical protein [Photobacterium leiognathi]
MINKFNDYCISSNRNTITSRFDGYSTKEIDATNELLKKLIISHELSIDIDDNISLTINRATLVLSSNSLHLTFKAMNNPIFECAIIPNTKEINNYPYLTQIPKPPVVVTEVNAIVAIQTPHQVITRIKKIRDSFAFAFFDIYNAGGLGVKGNAYNKASNKK